MNYHPLFLSPILSRSLSSHTRLSENRRYHAAPQAITPQPSPPAKLMDATNLAQAARIVMSVFQLSTFVTPALINPLYTSHILITLPQNYPVIQALGITNLSTFLAFHAHRLDVHSCRVANILVFAATAAIYLIIPIKPQRVIIPFTSSLIFIALANASALLETYTTNPSITLSLPTLAKLLAAAATIFSAFHNPLPLQTVYIFQIGLNLAAAAALALRSHSASRNLFAPDIILLLATAVCLYKNATTILAVMLAVTALFLISHFISSSENPPND